MPDTSRLGPLQSASVFLASGEVVFVGRGEELPEGLRSGEVERLAKAGAFNGPPVARVVTVPEAAMALVDYLPPQVTLAANPEPEHPSKTARK